MLDKIREEFERLKNPKQAELLSRFFKTGKGDYGEGDIFLGIKVPIQRKLAKKYFNLSLKALQELLDSKVHEHRQVALFILAYRFEKYENKEELCNFYLNNTKNINNWDLVDLSAPKILGKYLLEKDKKILYTLSKSDNLWEKRISIIATCAFIDKNRFEDTLKISEILLKDKHDLIHKAVGWMLREVGKRDLEAEEAFLRVHYKQMPRTMLRYAIEKFPKNKREFYMKK